MSFEETKIRNEGTKKRKQMRAGFSNLQWLCIFLFRSIFNALFVRTAQDPDEYWQSLEVAHKLSFGYGHLTWEWQKGVELRGYAHPLIFSVYYSFLKSFGIDTRFLVAFGPRVIQGVGSAVGDLYLYKLSERLYGKLAAKCALFVQIFSWFYFYCAVRTYANSAEMLLTIISLFHWPSFHPDSYNKHKGDLWKALIFAAVGVALRPTSAAFWVYLGLRHLIYELDTYAARFRFIFLQVVPIGAVTSFLVVLIDRACYGYWTFTPYNFLRVNLLQGISDEYGVHPWHWYLTQGIPAIVGTWLPMFFYGIYVLISTHRGRNSMFLFEFLIWCVFILSLARHKEFRFCLPIVPIFNCYIGLGLSTCLLNIKSAKTRLNLYSFLGFVVVTNVVATVFLSRYHQGAPLQVLDYLVNDEKLKIVDFLIPCHSVPFHSHIHRADVKLRFLDCSPQVEALRMVPGMHFSVEYGIEEEDIFFQNEVTFLTERYKGKERLPWPSHIVTTTDLDWLLEQGYEKCQTFSHTMDTSMNIYCLD